MSAETITWSDISYLEAQNADWKIFATGKQKDRQQGALYQRYEDKIAKEDVLTEL